MGLGLPSDGPASIDRGGTTNGGLVVSNLYESTKPSDLRNALGRQSNRERGGYEIQLWHGASQTWV